MCMVILSVLGKCHHELATIDYCPTADSDSADDKKQSKSEEKSTPRKPCTESLGWEIYKSLDAPVTCKSCKEWLKEQDKQTYGGMTEKSSKDNEADKPTSGSTAKAPASAGRGSYVWTSKGPALRGSPAYKLRSRGN